MKGRKLQLENKVSAEAEDGLNTAINNAQKYRKGLEKARKSVEKRGPDADVGGIVENRMKKVSEKPVRGP